MDDTIILYYTIILLYQDAILYYFASTMIYYFTILILYATILYYYAILLRPQVPMDVTVSDALCGQVRAPPWRQMPAKSHLG